MADRPDRASGGIRPFERRDVPDVAALRSRVFRQSEQRDEGAVRAYLEKVFFDSPWADASLRSLVLEDPGGRLTGFIGVLPRPMEFRGEPVRVAVTTQFMAAPEAGPLVAARLARAALSGPQDLTLADAANDDARRAWVGSGGTTAWLYSLFWTKPLRSVRHFTSRAPRGSLAWAALVAARPLVLLADALTPRFSRLVRGRPQVAGAREDLDTATLAATLDETTAHCLLRPRYDQASLQWLLDRLAERTSLGALQCVRVRDDAGRTAGCFIYLLNPGGVSQVVQVAARSEAAGLVLEHLSEHAAHGGATALEGRADPALVHALAEHGCTFARRGPWALLHTRRPELELAIHAGQACWSRLEGEWWLGF